MRRNNELGKESMLPPFHEPARLSQRSISDDVDVREKLGCHGNSRGCCGWDSRAPTVQGFEARNLARRVLSRSNRRFGQLQQEAIAAITFVFVC